MIPPDFDYVRARTAEEAVSVLSENDNAKLLAGGQSLLPILRLRLAYPDVVVDLSRAAGMWGIHEESDELVIGAMTTHYEVMTSELVRRHCGLLAEATSTVADPQVRHRGTLGGALSHADPAGDLGAVALAFGATLVVAGPGGRRSVPASEFFVDYLQTALEPTEVLVQVRLPKPADGTSPATDLSGQADYRQHLARVLTRSAVVAAAGI